MKKKKTLRIHLFDKVPFDKVNKEELIQKVTSWVLTKSKKMVLNMNTYGVVTFLENKKYAKIIRSSDLIYPDGWGPVYASRYLQRHLNERVNVGDFQSDLLAEMNRYKRKVFFLGSQDWLVKLTVKTVRKKYKKVNIVGYHHGYFAETQESKIVAEISKSKPNLVLIGMGLPKQEYFIKDNWGKLPPAVYMGIGGAFNYIARTKKRAPKWMRDNGLEWLFRFFQEPRRLGKRYTVDNFKFFYYFLKFRIRGFI